MPGGYQVATQLVASRVLLSSIDLLSSHCVGEKRNAYKLLVGKPEGKNLLGRPRHRWVDNTKIDLLEIGWGAVHWIGLAQDRDKWRSLVNAVMNLRVS
jgi:hypothetical protein